MSMTNAADVRTHAVSPASTLRTASGIANLQGELLGYKGSEAWHRRRRTARTKKPGGVLCTMHYNEPGASAAAGAERADAAQFCSARTETGAPGAAPGAADCAPAPCARHRTTRDVAKMAHILAHRLLTT